MTLFTLSNHSKQKALIVWGMIGIIGIFSFVEKAHSATWTVIKHNGREYVTAQNIKDFYHFSSLERNKGSLRFSSPKIEMRIKNGSDNLYINTVLFRLSYKVIQIRNNYLFSRIDLAKLIDPVLRPSYIKTAKRFRTVVLDPGHGGRDPGASRGNLKEKNITLLASKYLAQQLRNKGYEVYLTRNNDRFIRLSNRVKFARKKSAALFISIHADSTYNKNTRGMSIYSLSEKASDVLSQSLAESENKVDLIGGVDLEEVEKEVSDILIDLTRRETKNSSIEFAQLFIKYSKNSDINLLARPHRQAGFAVLKAPDVPSVLIEMGFISNRQDYNLLINEEYRRGIMKHLSNVVDLYLEKR